MEYLGHAIIVNVIGYLVHTIHTIEHTYTLTHSIVIYTGKGNHTSGHVAPES